MRNRITTLRCVAALLMACAGGAATAQAKFPTAPIRMLVGTPAGGTTDVIARLIAARMSQSLSQSVVVENRTGASGLIAAESVAKASADGYTVLMASSQLATYRALYAATRLEPEKDLEPLGIVATSPYVMVVHPSLPVKTLPELIAYAKANPGKISYAGSSPGTAQHLGWELIKTKAGVDMQYVPYKGTGALMPDLLAGRLQAGIDNVAILTPYIKSGQLRGVAVTSPARTPLLPDLPTVAASGVPDFQAMGWFGVFATGKAPPQALAALRSAVRSAMAAPEVREKLVGMGAEPQSGDPAELRGLLKRESTVWSKVIKDNHISAP
ncbi:Tricarboxylate transport protein TctC [Cupriavidus basilensis]|uniref:Tricarboxylate transport protein TctC n=2 Tax=Cupriavidus basilensis TaxID=68895 RepID=A0A0C4YJB3_9BURK|nr:Tricarboxylate transport protein TctC [Cupriavidus basilensis]